MNSFIISSILILYNIFLSMVLRTLKGVISQADMFCSSEMLRYNSQSQYKTLAGGLLSLIIICAITVGFVNTIAETINRTSITSTLVINKDSDPTYASLVPGKENMFMLGVSLKSRYGDYIPELNQGSSYFTFNLTVVQLNGEILTLTEKRLEPCTKDHWSMMPQSQGSLKAFNVSKGFCLPLNCSLPIQGGLISHKAYMIQISVSRCVNSTKNNYSCASQADIDSLFAKYKNFYLHYYYINPIINPNQQDYISYYIEAKDYTIFSQNIGSESWLYFSDYKISTDDSIWPYNNNILKTGLIVQQKAIKNQFSVEKGTKYASIFIGKSANSLSYIRVVQKVSAVLSNIGGLVGAVTAALFLIKFYTDCSLEITIGMNLFKDDRQIQKEKKISNIIDVFLLNFYRILKKFGWMGTSELAQRLDAFQNQTVKQLDVELLLRRLIKLECSITHLLGPDQLQKIWEKDPITLTTAKRMRKLLSKEEVSECESIKSTGAQQEFIGKNEILITTLKPNKQNNEQISSNSASSIRKHNLIIEDINLSSDTGTKVYKKSELPQIIKVYRESDQTQLSKTKKIKQEKFGTQ